MRSDCSSRLRIKVVPLRLAPTTKIASGSEGSGCGTDRGASVGAGFGASSRERPGTALVKEAVLVEVVDDSRCVVLDGPVNGRQAQLWRERRFVRISDACHALHLATLSRGVPALDVPGDDHVERRVDKNLDERARPGYAVDHASHLVPCLSVRRHEGAHDGAAVTDDFGGDEPDTSDILVAVLAREAQAAGQV